MQPKMFNFNAEPSALVQVAEIASQYKNQPDRLMEVVLAVHDIVPSLSEDVSAVIAREMGLSQNHVYSFVTFYKYLSVERRGKYIIRMCDSAPCHVRGAAEVLEAIKDFLDIEVDETTSDGLFTLETCSCMGVCDVSPAVMINDIVYGDLTPEKIRDVIKSYVRGDVK